MNVRVQVEAAHMESKMRFAKTSLDIERSNPRARRLDRTRAILASVDLGSKRLYDHGGTRMRDAIARG